MTASTGNPASTGSSEAPATTPSRVGRPATTSTPATVAIASTAARATTRSTPRRQGGLPAASAAGPAAGTPFGSTRTRAAGSARTASGSWSSAVADADVLGDV